MKLQCCRKEVVWYNCKWLLQHIFLSLHLRPCSPLWTQNKENVVGILTHAFDDFCEMDIMKNAHYYIGKNMHQEC